MTTVEIYQYPVVRGYVIRMQVNWDNEQTEHRDERRI